MKRQDDGVASVIGAILVLAVMGIALLYVNAVHVPAQGQAAEVAGRERAEAALLSLASAAGGEQATNLVRDLPLKPPRTDPPLLSGVVLTPVRAEGRLGFDPEATRITLSHVTVAPAGGVPADDPVRKAEGGGRMRVYDMGNATQGQPVGALRLSFGGQYLESATYRFEAGGIMVQRATGSALVAPPPLQVTRAGTASLPVTAVEWRLPVLRGTPGEVSGAETAQVGLAPGVTSRLGGGQHVFEVTVRVETETLTAWKVALEQVVGGSGVVSATATGPDRGVVTATILPPPGTLAGTPAVSLDLAAIRYAVDVTGRSGG